MKGVHAISQFKIFMQIEVQTKVDLGLFFLHTCGQHPHQVNPAHYLVLMTVHWFPGTDG